MIKTTSTINYKYLKDVKVEDDKTKDDKAKLTLLTCPSLLPRGEKAGSLIQEKCISLVNCNKGNGTHKALSDYIICPFFKKLVDMAQSRIVAKKSKKEWVPMGDIWVYLILPYYCSVKDVLKCRFVCRFFRDSFNVKDLSCLKTAFLYRERIVLSQNPKIFIRYDELFNLNEAGKKKVLESCNWKFLSNPEGVFDAILTTCALNSQKWILERNYNDKFANACFNVEFIKKETGSNDSLKEQLKEDFPLSDWTFRLIYTP